MCPRARVRLPFPVPNVGRDSLRKPKNRVWNHTPVLFCRKGIKKGVFCNILQENGFACSNVALGVGSFSMQCIEEDGKEL